MQVLVKKILFSIDSFLYMGYSLACKHYIEKFSYSEWWRYIGPVKPRQPLYIKEGANLSDKTAKCLRTIRGSVMYDPLISMSGFFIR